MKITRTEYTPEPLHILVAAEPGETVPQITVTARHRLDLIDGAGNPLTVKVDAVVPVISPVAPLERTSCG